MTTTGIVSLTDAGYTAFVCPVDWCTEMTVYEQGQDASSGWLLKAPSLAEDAARQSPGARKTFKPYRNAMFRTGDIVGYGRMVSGSAEFAIEAES